MDPSQIEVQGSYNSPKARHLKLMFEKCDKSTFFHKCKTDREISNWLKRKFILVLENQTRFDNGNYEEHDKLYEGRIVKESKISWNGLTSNLEIRQEIANKIRVTELNLQDGRLMHLDEMTEYAPMIFTTVYHAIIPYEFEDDVHLSISYEMDLNMHVAERTVYTFLDWLGDVGGLMGIVFDAGALLLMFFLGNGLNYILISHVFKEEGASRGAGGNDGAQKYDK